MSTNFLWYAGSGSNGLLTTLLSLLTTELESLTNGSGVLSSVNGSSGVFNNSNTGQGQLADLFFNVGNPGIGSAISIGGCLSGWFLTSPDGGTTFESTASVPVRTPDFSIPLPNTTISAGSVFKSNQPVIIPALPFKVYAQNNLGQTIGNPSCGLSTRRACLRPRRHRHPRELNVGPLCAQLILQRQLYIRANYKFKVDWTFCLLDPMDIIAISDANLGLDDALVRIVSIEEDDKGLFEITAEELTVGVADTPLYRVRDDQHAADQSRGVGRVGQRAGHL